MHKKGAEFNEHITRLPTPVVAREIQFKTTMKYHVIPNRTSEILKISLFLIFFCLLLLFFFFAGADVEHPEFSCTAGGSVK